MNKNIYKYISPNPTKINPNHKNNIGIISKDKMNAKNLFTIPIVLNLLYVNTVTKVIPNGGIINANKERNRYKIQLSTLIGSFGFQNL